MLSQNKIKKKTIKINLKNNDNTHCDSCAHAAGDWLSVWYRTSLRQIC
jgi:hypothetical protein